MARSKQGSGGGGGQRKETKEERRLRLERQAQAREVCAMCVYCVASYSQCDLFAMTILLTRTLLVLTRVCCCLLVFHYTICSHNVDALNHQPPAPSRATIDTISLWLHSLEMLSNLAQCRFGIVPLVGGICLLCANSTTSRSATTTGIRAVTVAVVATTLWRRWWWKRRDSRIHVYRHDRVSRANGGPGGGCGDFGMKVNLVTTRGLVTWLNHKLVPIRY
jgi:hypothetical protein